MGRKCLIALVLVLCLSGGLLFSQQISITTREQPLEFDSHKSAVTWLAPSAAPPYGFLDLGSRLEPHPAGLDREALETQSNQATKSFLSGGGTVAIVAVLALALYPLIAPPKVTDSYGITSTDWSTSSTIMCVGIAVAAGGGLMVMMGDSMAPRVVP